MAIEKLRGVLMDVFSFAIDKVCDSDIPLQLLEDAFFDRRDRYRRTNKSLEEAIRDKVILKRIMPDLNNIGGVMVTVNLNGCPAVNMENNIRVYDIPLALTNYRLITQVIGLYLNVTSNYQERQPGQSINGFYTAPIERSMSRVIASWRPMPVIANAHIELLGDNQVKINNWMNFSPDASLRCLVEFSENFSELKRPFFEDFVELTIAATKNYIRRTLAIEVDQAKLDGGRELGVYREFLDEYKDAYEVYKTLLNEKWSKILTMNDQQRKEDHIVRAGRTRV